MCFPSRSCPQALGNPRLLPTSSGCPAFLQPCTTRLRAVCGAGLPQLLAPQHLPHQPRSPLRSLQKTPPHPHQVAAAVQASRQARLNPPSDTRLGSCHSRDTPSETRPVLPGSRPLLPCPASRMQVGKQGAQKGDSRATGLACAFPKVRDADQLLTAVYFLKGLSASGPGQKAAGGPLYARAGFKTADAARVLITGSVDLEKAQATQAPWMEGFRSLAPYDLLGGLLCGHGSRCDMYPSVCAYPPRSLLCSNSRPGNIVFRNPQNGPGGGGSSTCPKTLS